MVTEKDKAVVQALIDQGLITQEQIDQLIEQQKLGLETAQKEMSGISFCIDLKSSQLVVKETFNTSALAEFSLNKDSEPFNPDSWNSWGQHICFIDANDGGYLQSYKYPAQQLSYGLVLYPKMPYVYLPEITQMPLLAQTQQLLYHDIYRGVPSNNPLDLTLSPDQKLLAVADRGSGNISLISTEFYQHLATANIRPSGSVKTLNVAFDMLHQRLLVTDNSTSNLFAIDLNSFEISVHKPGLGILGNIAIIPGHTHFYVLTLKPTVSLKYIHGETLKAENDIKLKGDLFSIHSNSPCDLVTLSPDSSKLLILTYLNEPEPFTPVVSVLDTTKNKTIKRYAVKDGIKPALLAFSAPNLMFEFTKDLGELVIQSGLVEPDLFWQIKRQVQTGAFETQDKEGKYLKVEQEIIDIERSEAKKPEESKQAPEEDKNEEGSSELESGSEAAKIELSGEATREIQDMLIGAFYKQTRIFLTQYPDEISRIQQESEKIKNKLINHASVSVRITGILQEHTLRTIISRDAILSILETRDQIKQTGASTSPTNCPNCTQPLLGRWECDACGLELESPERTLKRSIASVDYCSHLSAGNIGVPNPLNSRILQLDQEKYIVWELDVKLLSCYRPWDVLWLPQKHILIVDNELNKVVEYGADGSLVWELDPTFSPKHKVDLPVKATRYNHADGTVRYLIVDQGNHRVFEIDQKQTIHWEYTDLKQPSDIQYTHNQTYLIADAGNNRVLEIENDQVIWLYDDDEELLAPACVQRLFDEHTLIVDGGNQRIIELDENREIVWKFAYGKTNLPAKFKIENPTKMIRRENRNIILMDEFRMIEIIPSTSKIIWHMLIQQLKPKPNHKNPAPITFSKERNRQLYGVGVQQRFSLNAMLKKVPIFQGAEEEFFKEIARALKPVMFNKGQFIVTKGDIGNEMYFVSRGQVAVLKDDHKSILVSISEGDVFGEMALVLSSPRSASIRAQGYCELYKLERESFDAIISKYPNFKQKIQRIADERQQLNSLRKAEKSQQATDKLRKLIKSRKSPIQSVSGSKSFKAKDIQLDPLNFFCLDRSHNLVVKIDREATPIWHYGSEDSQTLVQPQSIRELPQSILIADTGNNRVLEVALVGKQVIKEFGSQTLQLAKPRSATRTHFGRTLIADQGNKRLVDIDSDGQIIWEYNEPDEIISPFYVEELESGNILFSDTRLHMVKEISREGELIWSYGTERIFGKDDYQLFSPEFATRLPDGMHTLVADTGNNRVLEIDIEEEITWEFSGTDKYRLIRPSYCQRLGNGNTIIYHNNCRQMIEVNREGKILWGFKMSLTGMLAEIRPDLDLIAKSAKSEATYTLDSDDRERIEQAREENKNAYELNFKLASSCQLKSVRASLIMMIVEKVGEIVKTYPTPAKMLENKIDDSIIVVLISNQSKEQLHEDMADIPEVEQVTISDIQDA